jgi:hypothetical protein
MCPARFAVCEIPHFAMSVARTAMGIATFEAYRWTAIRKKDP